MRTVHYVVIDPITKLQKKDKITDFIHNSCPSKNFYNEVFFQIETEC